MAVQCVMTLLMIMKEAISIAIVYGSCMHDCMQLHVYT